jgi:hypothetical protein
MGETSAAHLPQARDLGVVAEPLLATSLSNLIASAINRLTRGTRPSRRRKALRAPRRFGRARGNSNCVPSPSSTTTCRVRLS